MGQHEHYSDEELLRHLDGELAPSEQRTCAEHLKSCWMCRANLAELEAQIHALARSQREASFPGPGWSAEARWKFSVWTDKQEALPGAVPSFAGSPPNPRRLSAVAWPLACVAALAIMVWAAWQWSGKRRQAEEVLAAARAAEEAVYQQPIHQDFRVMISGHNAASKPWHGRLQIWSDPDSARLSAKLTTANGTIRQGVWRVEAGEEYVYDARTSSEPRLRKPASQVAPVSVWRFADDDAAAIEEGFIRWMDSRQWQPIAVSEAELLLAGLGGVLVRVETGRIEPATTMVRAEGADGRFVELTIDMGPDLQRPRIRKIRLAHPARAAELVLITERAESFAGAQLRPAIFRPDPSLYRHEVSRKSRPWPTEIRRKTVEPGPQSMLMPLLSPAALLTTQIEVYYALHEADACLGEPIHVTSTATGVVVDGLVETVARKNELLRVLGALPHGNPVSVQIQSVTEMVADGASVLKDEQGQSATVVRARKPALQRSVRSFLRSQVENASSPGEDEESLGQRAARLSNDAVRWSASLLAHSWSLRRLADALSEEQAELLTVRSKVLVENMAADHLRAMRASIGTEGLQVVELLNSIEEEGLENAAGAPSGLAQRVRFSDGPDSLFESVSEIDGMVRMLFAGDVRAAASGPIDPSDTGNTESTAGAVTLLEAIQQVDQRLDVLIDKPLEVVFQGTHATPQVATREGRQMPTHP